MNIEQERAEFEAWWVASGHFLSELDFCLMPDGRYEDYDVNVPWEAYQAGRAALQSQKPKGNDIMLSGVIRMPFEMAMANPISRMQFYQRAQQALNELEALQHSCKETSQDAEDAARFRFCLENGFPQKWEEMIRGSLRYYWTSSAGAQEEFPSAIEAIDHARRVEGGGE